MSREAYNSLPNIGSRGSPGTHRSRRLTELPTVDRSPSRDYQRGSPLGKHLITSHSLHPPVNLQSTHRWWWQIIVKAWAHNIKKLLLPLNGFHLKTKSIHVAFASIYRSSTFLPSLNDVTNQIILLPFPVTQTVSIFSSICVPCVIMSFRL